MEHLEVTLLTLFAVAAVVAIASQRFRLPYTIALVVVGVILGSLQLVEAPHLSKELLFLIVLPGLLFEAAYHMEFDEFWEASASIFTLAIPGLVVAIVATGTLVWLGVNHTGLAELSLTEAFVFGALISATDPISVLSLFRTLGVPKRLYVLVEGESLFNDGTAVVVFTMLVAVAMGGSMTLPGAALEFLKVVGFATLIGAGVGILGGVITRTITEPTVEITLTVLVAYGAFIIAESFHFSGVIACVVAGMLTGNWSSRIGMSASTRVAVDSFWSYTSFVLNSFVFLLVGFEIHITSLLHHWAPILIAWVAVTSSRGLVIFAKYGVLRLLGKNERLPLSWATILTWGGLRGGLSMVLALALPRDFVHRELILNLTFGVVLLSLLGQGLTMPALLRRLGLIVGSKAKPEYEEHAAELMAAQAALDELGAMKAKRVMAPAVLEQVHAGYLDRIEALESGLRAMHADQAAFLAQEQRALRRHLLAVEKDAIRSAHADGLVDRKVFYRLEQQLDDRLLQLDEGHAQGGEDHDGKVGESA
ncbi:MAG: Na+/H+ antiporter [Polyangiales bacterium]